MTAYLGPQDLSYNRLLRQAEQSQLQVDNDQPETAAPSQPAEQRIHLSNNLGTPRGPSTSCRHTKGHGFRTWPHLRPSWSKHWAPQAPQAPPNVSQHGRREFEALHGSSNSPSKKTTHDFQTLLRSQCCSTRHCATSSTGRKHHQHIHRSDPWRLNTTNYKHSHQAVPTSSTNNQGPAPMVKQHYTAYRHTTQVPGYTANRHQRLHQQKMG